MSYQSINELQNLLAKEVFSHTNAPKKASGRALGTFVEIIAYYLLKTWGLGAYTAIERQLAEYANPSISHKVEFTLHGSESIRKDGYFLDKLPLSFAVLKRRYPNLQMTRKQSPPLIDSRMVLKNAYVLSEAETSFLCVFADTLNETLEICRLENTPFAMIECKRVGVEEGQRKGPQTIEKAKQGSYVARTVSALQKIRREDGSLCGILEKPDGKFDIRDYYEMLNEAVGDTSMRLMKKIVLTIGVISNHGNWFNSDNQTKELQVLAQSYDWLLFLKDDGLARFITDLLENNADVKDAFLKSYHVQKKKSEKSYFTKATIAVAADRVLTRYFSDNLQDIESWFNVITPEKLSIQDLKQNLQNLSQKDWRKLYAG